MYATHTGWTALFNRYGRRIELSLTQATILPSGYAAAPGFGPSLRIIWLAAPR